MENKKFLPVIKVGGRRVVRRANSSREGTEKLRKILEENKKMFVKSAIDELTIEKGGFKETGTKLYKYKSNIKIIIDPKGVPVGVLIQGLPEIRNKLVFDVPEDFEAAVDDLNKIREDGNSKLEEALGID